MSSAVNRTIYVSNIPSHLPEPVIAAFFKSCGSITNLKLAGSTDQPSRYAFVEFSEPKAAHAAVTLSGTEIEGRKWKITLSHSAITSPPSTNIRDGTYTISHHHHGTPRTEYNSNNNSSSSNNGGTPSNSSSPPNRDTTDLVERTVYITSIDTQISEQQLFDVFSYCGHVSNYRICGDDSHPTRFAFFEFSTREAAVAALRMNGTSLGRYSIKVSPSRAPIQPGSASGHKNINYNTPHYQDQITRTVYVGSVDVSVTEDELQEFFQQSCGPVVKVALAGDSDHLARFAFVEFATSEARNKALTRSGTMLANKAIRVNASRTPILGGGKSYSFNGGSSSGTSNSDGGSPGSQLGHYPPPPTVGVGNYPSFDSEPSSEQKGSADKTTDQTEIDGLDDPWDTRNQESNEDRSSLKRKRSSSEDNLYNEDEEEENTKRPRYSDNNSEYNFSYNYYSDQQEQGM